MRFEIDRTTGVLVIFLLIIGGLFGYNYFVEQQPAQEFSIAVDPLAEDWAREAATAFNQASPLINGQRVSINVTTIDDYDVWRENPGWNPADHPIGWLAASSASLDYISTSLPFEVVTASTARTPLVWGGFSERVTVLTQDGERPFAWDAVQQTVAAIRWSELGAQGGNINMAIDNVNSSMAGLGALLTAFANYGGNSMPDAALLRDDAFMTWYTPIVESLLNSQRIGGSPAEAMATRGSTQADFALLPEVEWLKSAQALREAGFNFSYPAYQFMLDFPLSAWQDAQTTDLQRGTVAAFGEFLLREDMQALAVSHGLRPANAEPDESATLFVQARAAGILLEPDYGLAVQAPSRSDADAIIRSLQ